MAARPSVWFVFLTLEIIFASILPISRLDFLVCVLVQHLTRFFDVSVTLSERNFLRYLTFSHNLRRQH